MKEPLLTVARLRKHFTLVHPFLFRKKVELQAVSDVSFQIFPGETLGLVGESGCGKTTIGRTIVRLYKPTSGQVLFRSGSEELDLATLSSRRLKAARREMQIIYQDPQSSLNPRMTVGELVGEPLLVHGIGSRIERKDRVCALLEAVGLTADHMKRYPHEFSGGQRQRIAIARALILKPKFVVADEPVSALDVSIQAQVLNLLEDLQRTFSLTYLFIAHNLAVVKHISNRIAVMYLGRMVELAGTDALFERPRHPYTEALMSAIPVPDPDTKMERIILQGDIPNPIHPPSGCAFHPRCRFTQGICSQEVPPMKEVASGHFAACHFAEHLSLSPTTSIAGSRPA
jgi:oligopeptide/dipeptide ABC transporter ATP-binding protein